VYTKNAPFGRLEFAARVSSRRIASEASELNFRRTPAIISFTLRYWVACTARDIHAFARGSSNRTRSIHRPDGRGPSIVFFHPAGAVTSAEYRALL